MDAFINNYLRTALAGAEKLSTELKSSKLAAHVVYCLKEVSRLLQKENPRKVRAATDKCCQAVSVLRLLQDADSRDRLDSAEVTCSIEAAMELVDQAVALLDDEAPATNPGKESAMGELLARVQNIEALLQKGVMQ